MSLHGYEAWVMKEKTADSIKDILEDVENKMLSAAHNGLYELTYKTNDIKIKKIIRTYFTDHDYNVICKDDTLIISWDVANNDK